MMKWLAMKRFLSVLLVAVLMLSLPTFALGDTQNEEAEIETVLEEEIEEMETDEEDETFEEDEEEAEQGEGQEKPHAGPDVLNNEDDDTDVEEKKEEQIEVTVETKDEAKPDGDTLNNTTTQTTSLPVTVVTTENARHFASRANRNAPLPGNTQDQLDGGESEAGSSVGNGSGGEIDGTYNITVRCDKVNAEKGIYKISGEYSYDGKGNVPGTLKLTAYDAKGKPCGQTITFEDIQQNGGKNKFEREVEIPGACYIEWTFTPNGNKTGVAGGTIGVKPGGSTTETPDSTQPSESGSGGGSSTESQGDGSDSTENTKDTTPEGGGTTGDGPGGDGTESGSTEEPTNPPTESSSVEDTTANTQSPGGDTTTSTPTTSPVITTVPSSTDGGTSGGDDNIFVWFTPDVLNTDNTAQTNTATRTRTVSLEDEAVPLAGPGITARLRTEDTAYVQETYQGTVGTDGLLPLLSRYSRHSYTYEFNFGEMGALGLAYPGAAYNVLAGNLNVEVPFRLYNGVPGLAEYCEEEEISYNSLWLRVTFVEQIDPTEVLGLLNTAGQPKLESGSPVWDISFEVYTNLGEALPFELEESLLSPLRLRLAAERPDAYGARIVQDPPMVEMPEVEALGKTVLLDVDQTACYGLFAEVQSMVIQAANH